MLASGRLPYKEYHNSGYGIEFTFKNYLMYYCSLKMTARNFLLIFKLFFDLISSKCISQFSSLGSRKFGFLFKNTNSKPLTLALFVLSVVKIGPVVPQKK